MSSDVHNVSNKSGSWTHEVIAQFLNHAVNAQTVLSHKPPSEGGEGRGRHTEGVSLGSCKLMLKENRAGGRNHLGVAGEGIFLKVRSQRQLEDAS